MQWSPSVAVTLIEQGLSQLAVLASEDIVAGAVVTLLAGNPNVSKQLFLVPSLLLLKQIVLAQTFPCLVYHIIASG